MKNAVQAVILLALLGGYTYLVASVAGAASQREQEREQARVRDMSLLLPTNGSWVVTVDPGRKNRLLVLNANRIYTITWESAQ